MSTLRSFLVKLVLDPELRDRYAGDPAATLANSGLSPEEQALLLDADNALLEVASGVAAVDRTRQADAADTDPPPGPIATYTPYTFIRTVGPVTVSNVRPPPLVAVAGVSLEDHFKSRPMLTRHDQEPPDEELRAALDKVRQSAPDQRVDAVLDVLDLLAGKPTKA